MWSVKKIMAVSILALILSVSVISWALTNLIDLGVKTYKNEVSEQRTFSLAKSCLESGMWEKDEFCRKVMHDVKILEDKK